MAKDSNTLQYSPTGVYIFTALQSGFHSIESGEEADGGNDVACGVASSEFDEAEMLLEEAESMILQK